MAKKSSKYTKNDSFQKLETVQELALIKKGKNEEITPDISNYLKAEELKGKLLGLYSDENKSLQPPVEIGKIIIDGVDFIPNMGKDI